ncbi:MAG: hypothetical protein ABR609_00910, partial [Acidimicrobiia bacterium]
APHPAVAGFHDIFERAIAQRSRKIDATTGRAGNDHQRLTVVIEAVTVLEPGLVATGMLEESPIARECAPVFEPDRSRGG